MAKEAKKQLLSREQLRSLIQEENLKTPEDVHRLLKDMFGGVLQEMLEAEMDQNLGYEKNGVRTPEQANRRNGHSKKTVRSEIG